MTGDLSVAFLTIVVSMFVAELTDKDALLLLTLATRSNPWMVFFAGSIAFSITSAIIVLLGSALVLIVPIVWIKVAGGVIMLGYALLQYARGARENESIDGDGATLARGGTAGISRAFLGMLVALVVLDLAGDATELLTVIFVAQYSDLLLVFLGCVVALTLASGVEVILGNRLGKLLSAKRIRYVSIVVFLTIGSIILATALL